MSTVKWLVVRCTCFDYHIAGWPIDQVAIWRSGNRTKYIRHRTNADSLLEILVCIL